MRSSAHEYMLRGCETFDEGKGVLPSTHLWNWAFAGVMNYLYRNRVVRAPNNRINEQIKLNKGDRQDKVVVRNEISLDSSKWNEQDQSKNAMYKDKIHKQILNTITADMTNIMAETELKDHIEHVINREEFLSKIERFAIVHRMGLLGNEPKTQAEVASLTASVFGKKYSTMGINKAEHRAKAKLKDDPLFNEVLD
jgi:DNA-directed RNA polymerase sigma subunit (sigma70/sigma32)